ncbi:MAG: hypothetical protein ABH827_00610, partial [bacterium]
MVKKFLVIALAMAVVAPTVQANNVAQQVQSEVEARLVEVTGQTLTADDKEVLKNVVETTLENLPVANESRISKKTVAIIAVAIVAVIGTTYGVLAYRSGTFNPFVGSFYNTKEMNKEIAAELEAAKTPEQKAAEAVLKDVKATKEEKEKATETLKKINEDKAAAAKVEAERFAKLSKEEKAIELAEKALAKLKADKVKAEAKAAKVKAAKDEA